MTVFCSVPYCVSLRMTSVSAATACALSAVAAALAIIDKSPLLEMLASASPMPPRAVVFNPPMAMPTDAPMTTR